MKASSGASGISASDCKGEGATSQFKPLPLNKKEKTESKEIRESLEVKAMDSEKVDSESKGIAESARVGDSEKRGLESNKPESATDSESERVISADSKGVDCHADKLSRNDKSPESQLT